MFFPEKIKSIRPQDHVLEIGPGASPHPRSNAFLELEFDTDQTKLAQRGGVLQDPDFEEKPVYYYDGEKFPFDDGQFDYVICSHVIEHVENPINFLSEINRISSGRGYLEYPLITYEYLYDFNVHLHFMKFDFKNRTLRYLAKKDTHFSEFSSVTKFFLRSLENGWDDLCATNKELFFEGFEFTKPFLIEETNDMAQLVPSESLIPPKKSIRRFFSKVLDKLQL